ncbi:MAG: M23 family metallopeptidase [Melioribacteraceae bacterium]|nr:M23 family metallopeptidase [Melioribacteraceae bacterium]
MGLFNLENLKKTSVYITPNFPSIQTKRYKFHVITLAGAFLLYTVIIGIIITVILSFTPAKNLLFVFENQELKQYSIQIENLEKKVIMLTQELEELSNINKRLKYAITLASTDSLDSTAAIYDSLRSYGKKSLKLDGNIYAVILDFWAKYFPQDDSMKTYFIKPVNGIVGKEFNPDFGHNGVDYAVKEGSPVFAAGSGTVLFADYTFDYGYTIIIQHDNNYTSYYKHCSTLFKKGTDIVNRGELIALSGNTGLKTTGPHLHFEIWKNGKPLEPGSLLIDESEVKVQVGSGN